MSEMVMDESASLTFPFKLRVRAGYRSIPA
jgi:hypothetical protein